MEHPSWVKKQILPGTSVKKLRGNYYLYHVTSYREEGKPYPVSKQRYIGKITKEGLVKASIRILPEEVRGATLGSLVKDVPTHLKDIVLIEIDNTWMFTALEDEVKKELEQLNIYSCGVLILDGQSR